MLRFRFAIGSTAVLAVFLSSAVQADVVVISNRSRQSVDFELVEDEPPALPFTIEPQQVMAIDVDRIVLLRLSQKEYREFRLAPDCAYFFHVGENQQVELTRIGLGAAELPAESGGNPTKTGDAPNARDKKPPTAPSARIADKKTPLLTIPLKVLVDDEERAVRRLWEERLRKRVLAASEVFERQFRVRFQVVAAGTWESDDTIADFDESRREFQQLIDVRPARLAVGFSSQYQAAKGYPHLGNVPPPLVAHLLLPESSPQLGERDRCELLVHELAHYLGAVHSPEPDSAMRPALGDLRASSGFLLRIDPVNSLAIALVAEQVRLHQASSLIDLPTRKQQRLAEVYATLLQLLPDDSAALANLTLVDRPAEVTSDVPPSPGKPQADSEAQPPPATVEVRLDSFVKATQQVIAAIVAVADRNSRLAKSAAAQRSTAGLSGDELTGLYVRSAAVAALSLPAEQRGPAFFLGLALGLDRTEQIRKYAVLGDLVRKIEPDADRQRRLSVIGHPTLGGREDLVQHFLFSAAITAMAGESSAESVGLAKELTDSRGDSGFSFIDWCADLSGIALTKRVQTGEVPLALLATRFRTADFLPDVAGLEEGLPRAEFTRRFGSTNDKRFRRVDDDIRRRIHALYKRRD